MELVGHVVLWMMRLLAAFLLLATVLPLQPVGSWIVRACEIPRLQLAMLSGAGIVVLVAAAAIVGWPSRGWVTLTALVGVLGWQAGHILPYTPLWRTSVPSAPRSDLRLVVANLDVRNGERAAALDVLRELDADALLLIEIDREWVETLAPLREERTHRVEEIRGEGLGIALWSRLPLRDAQVRFLVSRRRPSIAATVELPGGGHAQLIGVHPTPPGLPVDDEDDRYDSRIRDAELLLVAEDVAENPATSWIVAGDFNDVAWSRTTRRFEEASGLHDPRVGRRLCNTYHAGYPLLRYPLDHVFVDEGFGVASFRRVRLPGSDHFAVLIELGRTTREPADETGGDGAAAHDEVVEEGVEDAAKRGER